MAILSCSTAICLAPAARAQPVPTSAALPSTKSSAFGGARVVGGSIATEEVLVTAQKRASTVQKTSASVAVITGVALQARGITSLATLAQGTPGVSLKSEGPSQTEIEMRGMTSSGGNSATVGLYLDDIPLTGPANAQNGHVVIDPDLYDLSRVEVLRGPQGTLFGATSLGGTVRLITNQPDLDKFSGSAGSTLSGTDGGSFNHDNNFMLNIPLVKDTLALRIVGTEEYTSGWIDRIVPQDFPLVNHAGNVRGDVADAPVAKDYPGSNAYQLYATRATLKWQPTADLTITPSFFYETSKQDGPSAYDSVSARDSNPVGGLAHYEVFDIAQPLYDRFTSYSLNVNYNLPWADLTSSTAYWSRKSQQTEEASEAFNNPATGVTLYANYGPPYSPGYYGPTGSGPEHGTEVDSTSQFSEELRLTSKGESRLNWVTGVYFSHFNSVWNFLGVTPNYTSFMDLGSLQPATTDVWFQAHEPTRESQFAAFGDAGYRITDKLKLDVGVRLSQTDYQFHSCINGWGSALGNATPSCTGLITQKNNTFSPKITLSYTFDPDLMAYGSFSTGYRPGGGNAQYPTTGVVWGAAFAASHYTGSAWPRTYKPDSVASYEIGEKARLFDHRLTLNVSAFYEHWRDIQLEAYPDDWALNINGKYARIFGAEADILAKLGGGFSAQLSVGYVNEYLDGGPHWIITPVDKLPEVAPESGTAILSYSRPVFNGAYIFTAEVENTYTGERYSLAFPEPYNSFGAYVPMAGYDLTNLRAGLKLDDVWDATLFVNNLFNKHAELESLYTENLASAAFNQIVTNQPLTGGLSLNYHF